MSMAKETCGLTTLRTVTWMLVPRGAAVPTTHLLPGPVSVPQNNTLNGNSAPGWTWDTAERVLISDVGKDAGLSFAISARRGAEPTQNVYRVGQTDLMHGAQAMGGMSYRAATAANPEVLYHAGLELQQLNPVWSLHAQQDRRHHHGGRGGTVVYLLGMDHGAGAQTHGGAGYVAGPMVGAVHPDYQLMPALVSPVAAWAKGSAMVPAGHPAVTWGAAYGEHLYYV